MIYVECKPDQTLVQTLTGLPTREIIHEQNKFEVMKKLGNGMNTRGMIDEDPGSNQPAYLNRMQVFSELSQDGLKVLRDEDKGNQVILLCPRLEECIIRAASDAHVDLRDQRYNLPNTASRLHREITFDLRKMTRLVQALRDSHRLRTLQQLLQP